MNIHEDIRELKTGDRELRKFGLTVGGVFAVLGLLFLWRHKAHYPYFLWPGIGLMASGAVLPRALKYIYLGWMSAAIVLGFVVAHVILTLFFFLVLTPIGLLARLSGKDFLNLKPDTEAKTYWILRESRQKAPADYERQY
jgi:hypothetical protein